MLDNFHALYKYNTAESYTLAIAHLAGPADWLEAESRALSEERGVSAKLHILLRVPPVVNDREITERTRAAFARQLGEVDVCLWNLGAT